MIRATLAALTLLACGPKSSAQAADAGGSASAPDAAAVAPAPAPRPARPIPTTGPADPMAGLESGPPTSSATDGPSDTQAALLRALSSRDAAPSCADLDAQTPDPVTDYRWIVEHVTMPPTAGIRAAECLVVGHAAAAADLLRRWVSEPQLKGFGWVTLRHLDRVEPTLARELATLSLTAGPDPAGAAKRIRKLESAELRALADDPDLQPR